MSAPTFQHQAISREEAELFLPLIQAAMHQDSGDIAAQVRYAETQMALGQTAEAMSQLRLLADKNPNSIQARGALFFAETADDPALSAAIAGLEMMMVNLYGIPFIQPTIHANMEMQMARMPYLNRNLGHIAHVMFSRKYPELCAVDMGSYLGSSVAEMNSKHAIPCLSIDCWPRHFALTRHNLRYIPGNHQVAMAAIGRDGEVLNILLPNRYTDGDHIFLSSIPADAENRLLGTIPTVSMQTLLADYPAYRDFKLLKLDLEGNEATVLTSSPDVLRQNRPMLFWEWNYEYITDLRGPHRAFRDAFVLLRDLGYAEHLFFSASGEFICRVPAAQLDQLDSLSACLLASRRGGVTPFCDICSIHADDADLTLPILAECLPPDVFAAVYG